VGRRWPAARSPQTSKHGGLGLYRAGGASPLRPRAAAAEWWGRGGPPHVDAGLDRTRRPQTSRVQRFESMLLRHKCDYLCEIYVRTAGTLYGRAGLAGHLLNHTGRATDRLGCKCDIETLDLRDGGPTILIHMDGHRGPAPLEPAAGVSRQLHVRGPGWDRWSLYIAGRNNTGCATAPDGAGGPTRVGAGRRQRLLRAEPAWAGTKMCRYGKVPFQTVTTLSYSF
jgi:hypothetical protein